MLQRRFASSIYAARRSLERMRDKRQKILEDPQAHRQEQIAKRLPEDFDDLPEDEQQEILDEPAYKTLADVPVPIDIVNVFRAAEALPEIARDAVAARAKALWCQFTVINAEGARIAEEGGLTVVMDRCLKVEHARYVGRMHWLGFNTQRITSVRGGLQ